MTAGQANVECAFDPGPWFAICALVRISARLWVGLCAALLVAPIVGFTTAEADAGALLSAVLHADELTRATLAQRLGDAAIVAALAQHEDGSARLAAVRCAPYLRHPERALAALAAIAAGRDPELAPAAARRARAIAQQLATQGAVEEDREEDREGLVAVQGVLRTLSESVQAAREVRLDAGQAAFLLERSAL